MWRVSSVYCLERQLARHDTSFRLVALNESWFGIAARWHVTETVNIPYSDGSRSKKKRHQEVLVVYTDAYAGVLCPASPQMASQWGMDRRIPYRAHAGQGPVPSEGSLRVLVTSRVGIN